MSQVAPYGSWRSPISAASVAADSVPIAQASCVGDDVYWLEGRPHEGGRYVLIRISGDGRRTELTPKPFNVRTRAHEYGGGAYLVTASSVYFSNFARPTPLSTGPRRRAGADHR
jgi:hypothetical protein